jgi:hypothetical protein
MSWALTNHWMVNFRASQGGEIPLRYRLTTHAGPCDDVGATRFGAEAATPPLVLRDYLPRGAATGSWITVPDDAGVLLTAKPAEDGRGVIVRVQNLRPLPQEVAVAFAQGAPAGASETSPLEIDGARLVVEGATVHVPVRARAIQSVRVRF